MSSLLLEGFFGNDFGLLLQASPRWDQAVSSVQEEQTCSLACVFLTDSASGLGRHSDKPDTPGHCWCRRIYGKLPAETYLSVVDMKDDTDGPMTQEKLWWDFSLGVFSMVIETYFCKCRSNLKPMQKHELFSNAETVSRIMYTVGTVGLSFLFLFKEGVSENLKEMNEKKVSTDLSGSWLSRRQMPIPWGKC